MWTWSWGEVCWCLQWSSLHSKLTRLQSRGWWPFIKDSDKLLKLLNHCNLFPMCLLTCPPLCSPPTCVGHWFMAVSAIFAYLNYFIVYHVRFWSWWCLRGSRVHDQMLLARLPNVSVPIGCGKIVRTHGRSRVTCNAGKVNRSFECYVHFFCSLRCRHESSYATRTFSRSRPVWLFSRSWIGYAMQVPSVLMPGATQHGPSSYSYPHSLITSEYWVCLT